MKKNEGKTLWQAKCARVCPLLTLQFLIFAYYISKMLLTSISVVSVFGHQVWVKGGLVYCLKFGNESILIGLRLSIYV
jgi:hypothetical protein